MKIKVTCFYLYSQNNVDDDDDADASNEPSDDRNQSTNTSNQVCVWAQKYVESVISLNNSTLQICHRATIQVITLEEALGDLHFKMWPSSCYRTCVDSCPSSWNLLTEIPVSTDKVMNFHAVFYNSVEKEVGWKPFFVWPYCSHHNFFCSYCRKMHRFFLEGQCYLKLMDYLVLIKWFENSMFNFQDDRMFLAEYCWDKSRDRSLFCLFIKQNCWFM